MKKLITFTSFILGTITIVAQSTTDEYYNPSKQNSSAKDRVSASIALGTGVSFIGSKKNTAITTFIAPKIGYQISERFKINAGLMHYSIAGNTFMPINQTEALINSNKKAISGNLLFVEGQYQLNKKVGISGAVMIDANRFENKQNNYKAISLGLDYKVSKHATIGVQATISHGDSPYLNNRNSVNNFGQSVMFGGLGQDFTNHLNSSIR